MRCWADEAKKLDRSPIGASEPYFRAELVTSVRRLNAEKGAPGLNQDGPQRDIQSSTLESIRFANFRASSHALSEVSYCEPWPA